MGNTSALVVKQQRTALHRALQIGLTLLMSLMLIAATGPTVARAGESTRAGHFHLFRTPHWYEKHQAAGPRLPELDDAVEGAFASAAPVSTAAMTYHSGPVMLTHTAYTIYWAPAGHSISASYQTLINRWFSDIGGSQLFNIVTQYYQSNPNVPINNASTFGGSWLDTINPYPHAGTGADPLSDSDIQTEVYRALQANHWPAGGLNVAFYVFTAKGIESCADAIDCTIGTAHPVYCAYHSAFFIGNPVIYANMPYAGTWATGFPYHCGRLVSPNSNADADEEISITSHEQFEAVTDPLGNAWYDAAGDEIGDKCAYRFGTTAADGHNVVVNGHPYIVQQEWSNAASDGTAFSGCALSFGSNPTPPTPTPTSTGTPVVMTPTATPTRTRTPSTVPTPSRTPDATSTATLAPTRVPTNTATRTATTTVTTAPTKTNTSAGVTLTPSPTRTSTPSMPSSFGCCQLANVCISPIPANFCQIYGGIFNGPLPSGAIPACNLLTRRCVTS